MTDIFDVFHFIVSVEINKILEDIRPPSPGHMQKLNKLIRQKGPPQRFILNKNETKEKVKRTYASLHV